MKGIIIVLCFRSANVNQGNNDDGKKKKNVDEIKNDETSRPTHAGKNGKIMMKPCISWGERKMKMQM